QEGRPDGHRGQEHRDQPDTRRCGRRHHAQGPDGPGATEAAGGQAHLGRQLSRQPQVRRADRRDLHGARL
ncbi:MAG: PTS system, mannitol-specific IIC component / PTS system, mannitol-specific IIB component / PTS system, mannitol-specific IIA component, partial [uncultured Rubrobacteraceae bacterium]